MKNNIWTFRIFLIVLLLPLLFINVKTTHDWGDDFAQYLIQARNITEGRPQTDNGLVMKDRDPVYALAAYPVGFPLLIAPVYSIYKLQIFPYCLLLSFILLLTGLLSFELFRKETTNLIAVLLALLFCYNPHILELKKEILSEIPFMFFIFLVLLWVRSTYSENKYAWVNTGMLFSLIVSVRVAGVAVFVAFILFEIWKILKCKNKPAGLNRTYKLVLTASSAIAFFILLNGFLFPVKAGNLLGFYTNAIRENQIQPFSNFSYYFAVAKNLFPVNFSWLASLIILLSIGGWILRLKRSVSLAEFFFPAYILLLLFFPYTETGMRFLIPLLPFFVYYFGYLIYSWIGVHNGMSYKINIGVLLVLILSYSMPLYGIISGQKIPEKGPQQKDAKELFDFVHQTTDSSVIVFCKARAISLYGGRPSIYFAKKQSAENFNEQIQHYSSLYLIACKKSSGIEINDGQLTGYLLIYKNNYEVVWENESFVVYRKR